MNNLNLIRSFLQQASAEGSRSTVLKPIGWMISICIAATLSASYLKLEPWVGYMFAGFCGLTMLLYLVAYLYCLFKDRDALRSETYTIQKMAIEKGFVGDSTKGTFLVEQEASSPLLNGPTDSDAEADK
jgi:hypothetical protein